jgi:hypothetical protein
MGLSFAEFDFSGGESPAFRARGHQAFEPFFDVGQSHQDHLLGWGFW